MQAREKTLDVFMYIQIMLHKMYWLLGFWKTVWKIFTSEFPQANEKILVPGQLSVIIVSVDILNSGGNFEE